MTTTHTEGIMAKKQQHSERKSQPSPRAFGEGFLGEEAFEWTSKAGI